MSETKQQRQLRIWRSLTPEQREYDRLQGRIPIGASPAFETEAAQTVHEERRVRRQWVLGTAFEAEGCTCHISPPCSFCVGDAGSVNRHE